VVLPMGSNFRDVLGLHDLAGYDARHGKYAINWRAQGFWCNARLADDVASPIKAVEFGFRLDD
jgi:hypothetical protein